MIIIYEVNTWQTALVDSWSQVWNAFLQILPRILGAIIIFVVGLILAYWAKKLVIEILKIIKVGKLTDQVGVDKYLKKADIRFSFIELIGTLVEWLVILVFFLAVVDILGLTVVSQVLLTVLGYVPNIIAAILIFAAGYIVGGIVDGLVRGALASVDHDIAKPLGRLSRWIVILIAFFAALDQLQIAKGLISTFFQGLTYTIVLVVGLSVGLGSKDLVAKVLDDWHKKIKK
ncbi:hypothetical protein ACFL0F_00870 [Patescibacteria group bacterium]